MFEIGKQEGQFFRAYFIHQGGFILWFEEKVKALMYWNALWAQKPHSPLLPAVGPDGQVP